MNFEIDVPTLALVLSISMLMQIIAFVIQYWMAKSHFRGSGWWTIGSIFWGLGFAFNFMRGIPGLGPVAIVTNNIMFITGLALTFVGIQRFLGQREQREWLIAFCFIISITAFYSTFINDNLLVRRVNYSVGTAVMSFLIAWSLFTHRIRPVKSTAFYLAILFLTNGAFFTIRALSPFTSGAVGEIFSASLTQTATYLDSLIITTLWTFGVIIMVNQRLTVESMEDKEIWETIFNNNPEPILIVRLTDGLIVQVNEAFSTLTGFARTEMIGKPSTEIDTWYDPADRQKMIAILKERGRCENMEIVFKSKTGRQIPVILSARIITLQRIPHILSIARDITESKHADEALRKSEEKFRNLVSDMQVGVLLQGPQAEILLSNPKALELLGLSEDQLLGKTSFDPDWNVIRMDGSPFPGETHPVPQAIATRKSVQNIIMGVYRPTTKDRVWLLVDAVPELNDDGSVGQVVCTFIDITERKQAEEKLRLNEERLRMSLEAATDAIWDWDLATGKTYFSPRWFGILGYKPNEIEMNSKAWVDLAHPDDKEAALKTIYQAIADGSYYEVEFRSKHADGHWVWCLVKGKVSERDATGKPIRLSGTNSDITARKQAEMQLKEYADNLEEMVNKRTLELRETQEKLIRHEKLAVLGQMAGSVGHELRNPLTVITNALYYLKLIGTDTNEKVKEYLGIIETAARTAEKIITDLLDFARIKSVKSEMVSVSDLIDQTLEQFPVPSSVNVTLEIPSDLPKVYVDPGQLIQVLGNLTVNACQAMTSTARPGSADGVLKSGCLSISAEAKENFVAIAVKDAGMGIPLENMNKLFEPLFTTKAKGIGLGLAVSQKLAEANNGRIEVQSEAGTGSTFTVFLPIKEDQS